MNESLVENRFKQILMPTILMAGITNIVLFILFAYLKIYVVSLNAIFWTLFFLSFFYLLKKDFLKPKQVSITIAYFSLVEVFIHSYLLGWSMGFYYYIFLLPAIFLLNTNWKVWMIVFFNSSVVLISLFLWYFFHHKKPFFLIDETLFDFVRLLNLVVSLSIMFVVLIYFSRTIIRKDRELINSNFILENKNKEIQLKNRKLEFLLKEVHHRVKNNMQIISSLISLEYENIDQKSADGVLDETRRRIEAISLVHQKIYQDSDFSVVDMRSFMEEIMNTQQVVKTNVNCVVKSPELHLDLDTAVPLGLILSEIIINSLKNAFVNIESPSLVLSLSEKENKVELLLKDNGVGLPTGFDIKDSKSLSMEIVLVLVDQIRGDIDCFNNKEEGSCYRIVFENQISSIN
jgi:two-component sensor histidine kinase